MKEANRIGKFFTEGLSKANPRFHPGNSSTIEGIYCPDIKHQYLEHLLPGHKRTILNRQNRTILNNQNRTILNRQNRKSYTSKNA